MNAKQVKRHKKTYTKTKMSKRQRKVPISMRCQEQRAISISCIINERDLFHFRKPMNDNESVLAIAEVFIVSHIRHCAPDYFRAAFPRLLLVHLVKSYPLNLMFCSVWNGLLTWFYFFMSSSYHLNWMICEMFS